jgi:hypothetical protein
MMRCAFVQINGGDGGEASGRLICKHLRRDGRIAFSP